MSEIKIKKSYFQIFLLFLVRWLNRFFVVLSLRKSRKFWGFVYDSVTKQPLDPVIVKLVYAQSGEPAQTCVTDLSGRYGFLAQPGKFKIFAKKSNYLFPSRRIQGGSDGIFTDIYKGEFFELYNESEVVGPNIPMDPIKEDWNQVAKAKILKTYPFLKLFFRRIAQVFFWFGFVWAFVFVLNDFFISYQIKFSGWPQYMLAAYLALFLLNSAIPEFRLWGRVIDLKTGKPVTEAQLELSNPEIQTVILAKAKSQDDGRFLLRANPGKYTLRISLKGLTSTIPVKVHGEGVVNLNFRILWINN
jgi:5-hydroxyisourate hydrolase-like protein (transthyretin family)